VDHHGWCGRLSAPMYSDETFGQVVVQLHRAQLPLAADAVADHEIGLGP